MALSIEAFIYDEIPPMSMLNNSRLDIDPDSTTISPLAEITEDDLNIVCEDNINNIIKFIEKEESAVTYHKRLIALVPK
jgi:hypothetical protein